MAAMTQMAASHNDSMNIDLTKILRDIHASYTSEMCKNVVNFTNKNLKGEYKDFKSGEDLPDVLNTMKKQGQVGPSNTESLKYFVQNAKKENKKILMQQLHEFEMKYRSSDNRDFVGRDTDVDIVLSSIKESESNVINVFGEKGVGKTTFASKVVEKLNVPDKQIYSVDLQQEQDVTTIITSILLAFNHPKAAVDPRKEVVYEIVDNLEKLTVVILDNFSLNEIKLLQDEQREFLNILEEATKHDKGSNLIILITSHSELQADFVKNHRLEALSSTNSAELLKDSCNDESTVDQIVQLCRNTPLHLQTTSAVLREKLIQPYEVLISKSNHDTSNLLIQAFDVFTPDMQKVAITLSLFQTPFTAKLAAMLLKCSSKEVNLYLGNLKFRHFLSLVNKKYSMHSLAKEVLAKKAKDKNHVDTYNEAQETFSRLFVKRAKEISDLSDKDYVKMYLQLQKEKHNLNLAFKISFEKGFLLMSSEFSDNFQFAMIAKCLQTGHERAELFRDLSAAALSKGELVSYIHLSSELILELLSKTSTKPEARELLKQIEGTLQEAPRDSSKAYLLAESSYEFAKGEIAYADFHNKMCSREEFDEGMACHEKCLQTRIELIGDHTETTRSLNAVGNSLMELQEHETALWFFTEAVEMRKRLSGEKEHIDSSTFMNQIGAVREEIGKKLKSQSRKMPEKKELYYQAEDQFKQEVDKFKEALNMERRLHIYGNIRTATFYRNLSNAYSYLEEYRESYIYAKKALRIRKKILGVDVNTVRSYYQIGVAYEWLDDSEKALKYYYKAYNMENKLPPGERRRVKLKVERNIQSLLGDFEEAVEFDSRTDEEAVTSDEDDDDERPTEEEGYYSDESLSEFGSSDEELQDQQEDLDIDPSKEQPIPTLTPECEPMEREESARQPQKLNKEEPLVDEQVELYDIQSDDLVLQVSQDTISVTTHLTVNHHSEDALSSPVKDAEVVVSFHDATPQKPATVNVEATIAPQNGNVIRKLAKNGYETKLNRRMRNLRIRIDERCPAEPTVLGKEVQINDEATEYRMESNPRGLSILINIQKFAVDPSLPEKAELEEDLTKREGSERDFNELNDLFSRCLNFKVCAIIDKPRLDILTELGKIAENPAYKDYDCLAVCIMSHGKDDTFYAYDGRRIKFSAHVYSMFSNSTCEVFRNKPKLFFVQACRGRRGGGFLDATDGVSVNVEESAAQAPLDHSKELDMADILIAYSSFEDYTSYRHTKEGSIFIQSLVSVFWEYADKEHILEMLTRIKEKVYKRIHGTVGGRTQVPVVKDTLRKKLYFQPSEKRNKQPLPCTNEVYR